MRKTPLFSLFRVIHDILYVVYTVADMIPVVPPSLTQRAVAQADSSHLEPLYLNSMNWEFPTMSPSPPPGSSTHSLLTFTEWWECIDALELSAPDIFTLGLSGSCSHSRITWHNIVKTKWWRTFSWIRFWFDLILAWIGALLCVLLITTCAEDMFA